MNEMTVFPFSPKGSYIIIYLLEVEKEGSQLWLLDFVLEGCHHIYVCVYVFVFVHIHEYIYLL